MAAIASTSCVAIMRCGVAFIPGIGKRNQPEKVRECLNLSNANALQRRINRQPTAVSAIFKPVVFEFGGG
jgi:hypothetical protein